MSVFWCTFLKCKTRKRLNWIKKKEEEKEAKEEEKKKSKPDTKS